MSSGRTCGRPTGSPWPRGRASWWQLRALLGYPKLLIRLLMAPAPDLYLVSYPGWLDVPIVRLVASLKSKPLVFDPFLSLFDTMISDRGLHGATSMVARLAAAADRWSLRLSDFVIADTEPQLAFYRQMAGSPEE